MLMTLRGYSRYRRCALSTIQKALADGRISSEPNGLINSEKADAQWLRNTATMSDADAVPELLRARCVRMNYQARLVQLKFLEQTGALVSSASVQTAAFARFRQLRDAMQSIPDRISAVIAAESDEAAVHLLLSNEIQKALNDVSGNDAKPS